MSVYCVHAGPKRGKKRLFVSCHLSAEIEPGSSHLFSPFQPLW